MKCPICGAQNRDSANFCRRCGLRFTTAPLPTGIVIQRRYKVVSMLGQGGMGTVYLVEDQRIFGRKCELK